MKTIFVAAIYLINVVCLAMSYATEVGGSHLEYSFNENQGTNVIDTSGNNYNGWLSNAIYVSQGLSGGGAYFSEDSALITPFTTNLTLQTNDSLSISFWWKASSNLYESCFISKRSENNSHAGLYFGFDNMRYYVATKIDHWATFNASVKPNAWYHAVLIKRGNSWEVFHNGQQLAPSATMGWPYVNDISVQQPLVFGQDSIYKYQYLGYLDQINVYLRALSLSDIQYLSRHISPSNTISLEINGLPQKYGAPTPHSYGWHWIPLEESLTNTVNTPVQLDSKTRQVCEGWTGSGSVPNEGSTNYVIFTARSNSVLTWKWLTEYWIDAQAENGGAIVGDCGWKTNGAMVELTAIPSNGYRFILWTGDVPGDQSTNRTIELTVDRARAVRAIFAEDGQSLMAGSILYYAQSRDSGDQAVDESGCNNHGVISNGSYTAGGRFAGGISFTNGAIMSPLTNMDMTTNDSLTLSFWWKSSITPNNLTFTSKRILNNDNLGLYFGVGQQNSYYLHVRGNHWAKFSTPLGANIWYHTTLVKKRNEWKVYHNGIELGLNSKMGWPYNENISTDASLIFARDNINVCGPFKGVLDEMMIFSRALNAIEIQYVYEYIPTNMMKWVISGEPGRIGSPTPHGFGTNLSLAGTLFTNSVLSPVVIGPGLRWICDGWRGEGSIPPTGTASLVAFTLCAPSKLTWLWHQEVSLNPTAIGSGMISMSNSWVSNGMSISITAIPTNGARFVMWKGDVPQEISGQASIQLLMDRPRAVEAYFARDSGEAPDGALLYYPFRQDSNTNVIDATGNGFNGSFSNAAYVGNGYQNGAALIMPPGGIRVPVGSVLKFRTNDNVSILFWWKATNSVGVQTFFSKRAEPNSNKGLYFGTANGRYNLHLEFNHWALLGSPLSHSVWHHTALIKNGTAWKVFHNGLEQGVYSQMGMPHIADITTNVEMMIGSDQLATNMNFSGYMDEIMVFNRALSTNEVIALKSYVPSNKYSLIIQGNPANYALSYPYNYGTNHVNPAQTYTNIAISPFVASTTLRHRCAGWTGSGDVAESGSGTSVVFTVTTNSSLTWLWDTDYRLTTAAESGGAVLPASDWIPAGSNVAVVAVPLPGYSFDRWIGLVAAGEETQRWLTVVMTEPRNLTAQFVRNTCDIAGRIAYEGPQTGPIQVEAFSDGRYEMCVAETQIANPGVYQINGLPAGGTYWIRAYRDGNANGSVDGQEPIGAYVGNPLTALLNNRQGVDIHLVRVSAPKGLQAIGGAGGIALSWNPNLESGIAGYNVYRFDLEWGQFERLNSAPIPAPAYWDRSISRSRTYWYYVTAIMQSEWLSDYLESPPSTIVSAASGRLVIGMPDYRGTTGGVARLRVNVANAEGILGDDLAFALSYDPAVLTPLSQNSPDSTVETTVLTQGLSISNNASTATGRLDIAFSGGEPDARHATLRILGCHYESGPNRPIPIKAKYRLNGGDWLTVNTDHNVNNGRSYAVDLGELGTGTNCAVATTELAQGRTRQSDSDEAYVKTFRNGDVMTNLPGVYNSADLAHYVRPYVHDDLVVRIGDDEVLYLFELGESAEGPDADFQDMVAMVEFNQGSVLKGQGHLFDVLFKVTPAVNWGVQTTNRMLAVQIRDQSGALLACDYSDVAVFQVQSNYFLGDIDGDGRVDVSGDFTLAMKLAVGQRVPTALEMMAGDIDGDGAITKLDATLIKRIAQGLPVNPGGSGHSGMAALSENAALSDLEGYQLTLGRFEVLAGSLIEVPVVINNGQSVASIDLRINYDSDFLVFLGARTADLTAAFGIEAQAAGGVVAVVLSSDVGLLSDSGTVAVLSFAVSEDAAPGAVTELTLAQAGLGTEFGAELGWSGDIETTPGLVTVVLSKDRDSDGDGLSDYEEQFFDGQTGYNPWNALLNPWGTDPDVNYADTDGDGMNDANESAAGTSPVNRNDVLALKGLQPFSVDGWELSWPSVTGKSYHIEIATNWVQGFTPLSDSIPGDGTIQVWHDTNIPSPGPRFYRIRKE